MLTQNQDFDASFVNSSVWVVRGAAAGSALCLTAGIHGDEINGVEIGARLKAGDHLGPVHAPGNEIETPIVARRAGTVIGMAVPQIVLSGYALFNIGIEGSDVFPGLLLQESSDPTGPEVDG